MAKDILASPSPIALTGYLIYYLAEEAVYNEREVGSLEYAHLPREIACTSQKMLWTAFTKLQRNGLLNEFAFCEDGVLFRRSSLFRQMALK